MRENFNAVVGSFVNAIGYLMPAVINLYHDRAGWSGDLNAPVSQSTLLYTGHLRLLQEEPFRVFVPLGNQLHITAQAMMPFPPTPIGPAAPPGPPPAPAQSNVVPTPARSSGIASAIRRTPSRGVDGNTVRFTPQSQVFRPATPAQQRAPSRAFSNTPPRVAQPSPAYVVRSGQLFSAEDNTCLHSGYQAVSRKNSDAEYWANVQDIPEEAWDLANRSDTDADDDHFDEEDGRSATVQDLAKSSAAVPGMFIPMEHVTPNRPRIPSIPFTPAEGANLIYVAMTPDQFHEHVGMQHAGVQQSPPATPSRAGPSSSQRRGGGTPAAGHHSTGSSSSTGTFGVRAPPPTPDFSALAEGVLRFYNNKGKEREMDEE